MPLKNIRHHCDEIVTPNGSNDTAYVINLYCHFLVLVLCFFFSPFLKGGDIRHGLEALEMQFYFLHISVGIGMLLY